MYILEAPRRYFALAVKYSSKLDIISLVLYIFAICKQNKEMCTAHIDRY